MATKIHGTNTAAAPGITGDDADSGLFYGTDQVSVSTAGTERFRVGSAGQLGIGGATYGTDGHVLTSTGASSAPAWEAVSSVGGATGVDFNDNVKARWGTGNDLEIYHDGSNSYIKEAGTGDFLITTNGGSVQLQKGDTEVLAHFGIDGENQLYHDNTKVVVTDANGLQFDDGKGITLGTDDDQTIRFSGSDTTFNRPTSGAVNFYFDDNDATTNHIMRIGKTGDATNNERHQLVTFVLPGNNRGLISCGSSISEAPIFQASSDYRVKENFRPYTGGWDAIKAIPVQLYDEKAPSYWAQGSDKKDMKGWRAHEVQAVMPEAVTGAKDAVVTQA